MSKIEFEVKVEFMKFNTRTQTQCPSLKCYEEFFKRIFFNIWPHRSHDNPDPAAPPISPS